MSGFVRTIRTSFGTARTHPVQRAALRYHRLFIESLKKKHRLSKKDSNSKFSRTRIYHIAFDEFSRDLLLADFLFRACRFTDSKASRKPNDHSRRTHSEEKYICPRALV